jgi:hypothetical protein
MIDLREEQEYTANDWMYVNSESVSNKFDESDLQCEKRDELRLEHDEECDWCERRICKCS